MIAENLRIGDHLELTGKDPEESIKELHELCMLRRTPHVHVVTTRTAGCFGFRQRV